MSSRRSLPRIVRPLTSLLATILTASSGAAQQAEVLLSRTVVDGRTIADGNFIVSSLAGMQLGGGVVDWLEVGLTITAAPGNDAWSGDYYAYLAHNDADGFAVLLNRIGRTASNPYGSGHNGIEVTFSDEDGTDDVHLAPFDDASLSPPALTGTWVPSGRQADPASVTDASPRTAFLDSFLGRSADGEWRLLVLDEAYGGLGVLQDWSLRLGATLDGTSVLDPTGFTLAPANGTGQVIDNPVRLAGATTLAGDDDLELAGPITLAAASTITPAGSALVTLSGDIGEVGGPRSLTIGAAPGGATVVITGDSTYSGGTTLQGDVSITRASSLGSGPVNLAPGDLAIEVTTDATFANPLSGTGGLTKSGAARLLLAGDNSHSGGTEVLAGTLAIGHASALGSGSVRVAAAATLDTAGHGLDLTRLAGAGTVTGSGTFTHDSDADATLDAVLAGSGSLAKDGSGVLTLGAAATYTGDTVVADGTLRLANPPNPLTSVAYSLASPQVFAGNDSINTGLSSAGTAYSFFAVVTPATTDGALTVLGSTAFSAPQFRVDYGQLQLVAQYNYLMGGGGSVSANTPTLLGATLADGQQTYYVGNALVGQSYAGYGSPGESTFLVGVNGFGQSQGNPEGFQGTISSLLVFESVLSGEEIAFVNAYLAGLYLGGPPVSFGGSLPASSALRLIGSGATFDLNGRSQTVASLHGVAGSRVLLGSGTLTTGGGDGDSRFDGAIEGTGSLVKTGQGVLTIGGPGLWSGGTTVEAGELRVANSSGSALGSGPVEVEAGATLSGSGSFSGPLNLAAGGTLSPGESPGNLTIGDGSVLAGHVVMELGGTEPGVGYDTITVGASGEGSVLLGGTLEVLFWTGWAPQGPHSFQLIDAATISGAFTSISLPGEALGYVWNTDHLLSEGRLDLVAIPEPAAFAAIVALAVFAAARRRRRTATNQRKDRRQSRR